MQVQNTTYSIPIECIRQEGCCSHSCVCVIRVALAVFLIHAVLPAYSISLTWLGKTFVYSAFLLAPPALFCFLACMTALTGLAAAAGSVGLFHIQSTALVI